MVSLPVKTYRDSLGIDTVTRGLVWGCLYLKACLIKENSSKRDYLQWTINTSNNNGYFLAEIKLPYNSFSATAKGIDLTPYVLSLSEESIDQYVDTPYTDEIQDPIPTEPESVINIEQYLYWLATILSASTFPNIEFVKISIFDSATINQNRNTINEPQIKIDLRLPINYKKYLITQNIIYSVEKIVAIYTNTDEETENNIGALIQSAPYWHDPINDEDELKALSINGLNNGTLIALLSDQSLYLYFTDLPTQLGAIIPNDADDNQGWLKASSNNDGNSSGSLTWETLLGRPTFAQVAISGNYNHLSNKPSIPDNINQLSGYDSLVRTVNDQEPDVNGNVQITVNVGSVDWENVGNKPSLSDLGGWETVVRTVNDQEPDVNGNVAVTAGSVSWENITNKPGGLIGRDTLTENRNYYIRTDGDDNNNGLFNASNSAFLTWQEAIDTIQRLDLNGYNVNLFIIEGTYNVTASVQLKDPIGEGKITIKPIIVSQNGKVILQSNNDTNSFNRSLLECINSTKYTIENIKLICQHKSQSTDWNVQLYVAKNAQLIIKNIDFGNLHTATATFTKHILVESNAHLAIDGNYSISGAAGGNNNNASHINFRGGAIVEYTAGLTAVTITNTPIFHTFVVGESNGLMQAWQVNFNGSIESGCRRWIVDTNAVVKTWGSTTFPGTIDGIKTNGGETD